MIKQYDYLFKIVIIGDSGVGKSSLLLRFADDQFHQNYLATIGVDFRFKTINIDGSSVKFQIWDTAGQQRFRTITSAYYKGCQGIAIVYDITNKETFQNIDKFWINQVQSYTDSSVKVALIGNKTDEVENRAVDSDKAMSYSRSKSMIYSQVSAKTADNVNELFTEMGRKLIEQKKLQKKTSQVKNINVGPGTQIKVGQNPQGKKKCC